MFFNYKSFHSVSYSICHWYTCSHTSYRSSCDYKMMQSNAFCCRQNALWLCITYINTYKMNDHRRKRLLCTFVFMKNVPLYTIRLKKTSLFNNTLTQFLFVCLLYFPIAQFRLLIKLDKLFCV